MVIMLNTIYITLWADYELAAPGRLDQLRVIRRTVGETSRNPKKIAKTLQHLSFG